MLDPLPVVYQDFNAFFFDFLAWIDGDVAHDRNGDCHVLVPPRLCVRTTGLSKLTVSAKRQSARTFLNLTLLCLLLTKRPLRTQWAGMTTITTDCVMCLHGYRLSSL